MAMMSFAGYFHARFLLSAFFPVCLSYLVLFFPTVFVHDLFWCSFPYLVTTAGFVCKIINNVCDFVSFRCFVFRLSSSCDIGEPGMGSAPLSFLGS